MKTIKLLLCLSLFIFSFSFCEGQSWDWGAAGYGSIKSNDFGSPVATDKNGNVYITGNYDGSMVFGSTTLSGSTDNAYLTKYNSAGNLQWAIQPIDSLSSSSFGTYVTTNNSGMIYITGRFIGTMQFGSCTLRTTDDNNGGNGNVYLVKYSPDSNVIWGRQAIAPSRFCDGTGYSLAIDKSGDILLLGDFDDSLIFGANTLVNPSAYNEVCLIKYDSNGNVLWAKQSVNANNNSDGFGYSVTTDKLGNSYITGSFFGTISFDSYTLTSSSTNFTSFIVKYSPAGNVLWAKQSLNSSSPNSKIFTASITSDDEDNPYITGYFNDSVNFGNGVIYSPTQSAFITKYDSTGNLLWVKQSSPGWQGSTLAKDASNNLYFAGVMYSQKDTFKFGSYNLYAYAWTTCASVLMKFDTSGTPICGSILNGLGLYQGDGVASDSAGKYIYIAGLFNNDTVFCATNTFIASAGAEDVFVGRWQNCGKEDAIPTINSTAPSVTLFPNPSKGIFTIVLVGAQNLVPATIEIYNVLGEKVYSQSVIRNSQFVINLNQPNGIYLYRVVAEDGSLIGDGKVIIEK